MCARIQDSSARGHVEELKHGEPHEVARLRIQIESPVGTSITGQGNVLDGETADNFFRQKGALAPALAVLSLLDSALDTVNPVCFIYPLLMA